MKDEWKNAWKDIASLGEDREMGIKKMFYDWSEEMDVIRKLQKCQRVWDHSKSVHQEVIDYLLYSEMEGNEDSTDPWYSTYQSLLELKEKVLDEEDMDCNNN